MIQISTASAFQNDDERISTASAFQNDDERTSVIDGLKKLEIKGLNILNYGKVLKATFLLFSTVYFTMMNHNHPANAPPPPSGPLYRVVPLRIHTPVPSLGRTISLKPVLTVIAIIFHGV